MYTDNLSIIEAKCALEKDQLDEMLEQYAFAANFMKEIIQSLNSEFEQKPDHLASLTLIDKIKICSRLRINNDSVFMEHLNNFLSNASEEDKANILKSLTEEMNESVCYTDANNPVRINSINLAKTIASKLEDEYKLSSAKPAPLDQPKAQAPVEKPKAKSFLKNPFASVFAPFKNLFKKEKAAKEAHTESTPKQKSP